VTQGPLILTIDVGTSSVRAMLFDAEARPVEGMEAQIRHQMQSTADGGVQTDADVLFERVCECIDGLLAKAGDRAGEIAAVAPTTFWHNVLGVSRDGRALTPLYTWADTRATGAAAALRETLDARAVHERTGCVIHPSYLPAKLHWLLSPHPKPPPGPRGRHIARRARWWLSFAEFMILTLFGSPACSISMASGSGLLDQHRCKWDGEVLRAIPLDPEALSPLDDGPRRGLRPPYARRWPALARVAWFPGWGDGATSNVGCGCVTRKDVAMMVGTSGAMRVVWQPRRLAIPPRLWCYRVDARRVVMGGALSNGGNLLEWLRNTLRVPEDPGELERAVKEQKPDGHGLTFLPFLAGERSPGWHSEATATISGLRLHTTPIDIVRAGYEEVAYRFGLIYRLLREALPGIGPVTASGGALLHSPAWMQIMADVLGHPVTASAVAEASSRGAALLALEAIGAIPSIEGVAAPRGTTYRPNRAHTRIYAAASARQHALYELLIERGASTSR
jgi:gluconokinase